MRIDLSANDTRSYRHVKLDNGLQVVLVSGTDCPKKEITVPTNGTAWAITIPMGCFSDPLDAAGLSDLIRRTLVQEILDDLSIKNVQLEAYTNNEWTTFYADVEPKRFGWSLDMLTKHLCNPKFETKHIEMQLLMMEQDYNRCRIRDENTLRHFIGNLSKSQSPYRNVKKGSMSTLIHDSGRSVENLRSMMFKQLANSLDSRRMTFAAESITDTLDGLEITVQQTLIKFQPSEHPNPIDYAKYADSFDTEEFQKLYNIISARGKNQLRLIWSLPCLHTSYRSNPILVLGSLIRNLQEGGLAHRLEEEHLATDVECVYGSLCNFTNSSMNTLFMIRMHLTETGNNRVAQICGIVYEYLKFVLSEASKCLLDVDKQNPWGFLWKNVPHTFETYVRELQVVQESRFMNQPMLNPQVTAVWLANAMRRVHYQDLYSGYQLIQTPDTKVYHKLLSELVSKRCCIIQCTNELESNVSRTMCVQMEPYCGTRFIEHDFPDSLIQSIEDTQCKLHFSLPARIRNSAEDFTKLPCSNGTTVPTNLNQSSQRPQYAEYGALWHEPLHFFQPPRGMILLQLSSLIPLDSERNSTLLMLFSEDVRQNMQEIKSQFCSAKMSYDICTLDNDVLLSVCGPSEHLRDFYLFLIREVLKGCSKMDLDQFDDRRKGVQAFIDQAKLAPELLADNILMFLTKRTGFIYTDPLKDFPRMTIADLMAFASQLLCQLSINMYVAGEISKEDAQSMYDRTVRAIGCIPTLHKKEMASLDIAPGTYHHKMEGQITGSAQNTYYFVRYSTCLRTDAFAEAMNRSLVLLFNPHITQFLCSESSPKVNITVQLKQTITKSGGHSAIQISVRSDEMENADEHWLPRVAAFWYRIAPLLILSLSDTELENLRNSVITQFKHNPSDLDEYMKTVWETVMKWEANFEFVEQIVQNATRMTQSDLYKFYFDHYLDLNQQRTIILEITPNRSRRVVRKGSFRRQFLQAADVLDDEIAKFIARSNIDAHAGELHGGDRFRLIDRFYPERMKTIHDLHVFRNQNPNRRRE